MVSQVRDSKGSNGKERVGTMNSWVGEKVGAQHREPHREGAFGQGGRLTDFPLLENPMDGEAW